MRLVCRAFEFKEPVLLVGETGTGKTTACQAAAAAAGQQLHIVNCNQHTEASDFLGGFRPTRCRAPPPFSHAFRDLADTGSKVGYSQPSSMFSVRLFRHDPHTQWSDLYTDWFWMMQRSAESCRPFQCSTDCRGSCAFAARCGGS